VQAKDSRGWTALSFAAVGGHAEAAMLLCDCPGNVVDALAANGETALHRAARGGHVAVVQNLLDRGAGLDHASEKGWTALTWATQYGQVETLQLLMDRGAAINPVTTDGRTPLSFSKGRHDPRQKVVFKMLTDAGGVCATPTGIPVGCGGLPGGARDERGVGVTAAAAEAAEASVSGASGANIRKRGEGGGHQGNNALHWAVSARDWAMCKKLIVGPDGAQLLQERNRGGSTMLILLASGACGAAAAELLELVRLPSRGACKEGLRVTKPILRSMCVCVRACVRVCVCVCVCMYVCMYLCIH
jgi:hypothetical protein